MNWQVKEQEPNEYKDKTLGQMRIQSEEWQSVLERTAPILI